jgi:hypothetical protein
MKALFRLRSESSNGAKGAKATPPGRRTVVSETLGYSSIQVTKDVYGHRLAPTRAAAADAIARALWSSDADSQLATDFATQSEPDHPETAPTSEDVGRRGLEPGTLGLDEHEP